MERELKSKSEEWWFKFHKNWREINQNKHIDEAILKMLGNEGITLEDTSVLDIGAGAGSLLSKCIYNLGANVIALDIVKYPLTIKHHKRTPVQANALELPFKEKTFDLVISQAFLDYPYIMGYERKVISEIYRVLNDKSYFLFEPFFVWRNELDERFPYLNKHFNVKEKDFIWGYALLEKLPSSKAS